MNNETQENQWPSQSPENVAERQKKYYWSHREKRLADNKAWRERNKEHRRQKRKEYAKNERVKRQEARKQYLLENPPQPRDEGAARLRKQELEREYYKNNRQKRLDKNKRWYDRNKDHVSEQKKEYYEENKSALLEKAKKRHKIRRKEDPNYRLVCNLRGRVCQALKKRKAGRKTLMLIGCSVETLVAHLESQFTEGMTWENYGEWHVDHKHPIRLVDLDDEKQLLAVMNYQNLQPLWASENCSKQHKLLDGCQLPEVEPYNPPPQSEAEEFGAKEAAKRQKKRFESTPSGKEMLKRMRKKRWEKIKADPEKLAAHNAKMRDLYKKRQEAKRAQTNALQTTTIDPSSPE